MIDFSRLTDVDLVKRGQELIPLERIAILRTFPGRQAAIRELMDLRVVSRQRRISPKKLMEGVGLLTFSGDPGTDVLTLDALQLFNSSHWNRVRAEVDAAADPNREEWVRLASEIGQIVGVLATRHRGMMHKMACRAERGGWIPMQDLMSEMLLAIPSGIERFRFDAGSVLSGLVWTFKAAIYRMMEKSSTLKMPKRTNFIRQRMLTVLMERAELNLEEPTSAELADMLNVPETTIQAAMTSIISLDGPIDDDDDEVRTVADTVAAQEEEDPAEVFDATYLYSNLHEQLETMPPDKAKCFLLHVGMKEEIGIKSLPIPIEEARRRLQARAARTLTKYAESA